MSIREHTRAYVGRSAVAIGSGVVTPEEVFRLKQNLQQASPSRHKGMTKYVICIDLSHLGMTVDVLAVAATGTISRIATKSEPNCGTLAIESHLYDLSCSELSRRYDLKLNKTSVPKTDPTIKAHKHETE